MVMMTCIITHNGGTLYLTLTYIDTHRNTQFTFALSVPTVSCARNFVYSVLIVSQASRVSCGYTMASSDHTNVSTIYGWVLYKVDVLQVTWHKLK